VWSVVSRVERGGQEAYRNDVFFFSYECSVYFMVFACRASYREAFFNWYNRQRYLNFHVKCDLSSCSAH